MKKVLIIAYYFPPMGGSGVQRPLKFVKYLRDFGWEPVVLCPEPGAYPWFDESLQDELKKLEIDVHRIPGATPLHVFGKQFQLRLPAVLESVLRKISTFFWLPDNKKGWIQPACDTAIALIKDQEIAAVFATAMPFSNLLLASRIKERTGIPVIMDLRDEWMESHLLNFPTPFHKRRMAALEEKTLSSADLITVINEAYKNSIGARYPEQEIQVLNQGYDPEDFGEPAPARDHSKEKVVLLHSGLIYGDRQTLVFLDAVKEVIQELPEASSKPELRFLGEVSPRIQSRITDLGLEEHITIKGYVSHKRVITELNNADILWLMISHQKHADKLTLGKMFEYFGTSKPIFALIPEGESRRILERYGASYFAYPFSKDEIKRALVKMISDYQLGSLPIPNPDFIKHYDRKVITGELASLLHRVVKT